MTITLILRKIEHKIEGTHTVLQALKALNLSPETHLVLKDGELQNENDILRDGDVVTLVAVISGG
jgi:sulfur carrier protein ThiS